MARRSKSPAPVVAHNRFHFKCCDNPPPRKPTVEEVKAKSLENSVNAQKRRRERSNQRPGLISLALEATESQILNLGIRKDTCSKSEGVL